MKLLLTSNGINNQSIADALVELIGKPAKNSKIGFIPTAVNVEVGNKDWFITQLTDLQKFGFEQIDIVEIAASDVDWRSKFEQVDVIYAGGGNTHYLLDAMRTSGFADWLEQNIDNKVYVGGSAGAIVVTPNISVTKIKAYSNSSVLDVDDLTGLGLVDFEIAPHIPNWPSYADAEEYAKTTMNKVYALDNQSAIQVVDGKFKVISEGQWKQYN
jgi:dipeptidase E